MFHRNKHLPKNLLYFLNSCSSSFICLYYVPSVLCAHMPQMSTGVPPHLLLEQIHNLFNHRT